MAAGESPAAVVPVACLRPRTPGRHASLACSFAPVSTNCWLQRRLITHAPAKRLRTARITRHEVDAEPALRAPSGIADVGVLTRRLAPGTTPAARCSAAVIR